MNVKSIPYIPIVILVTIAIQYFIYTQIIALAKRKQLAQARIDALTEQIKSFETIANHYDEYQNKMVTLNKILPTNYIEFASLIQDLSTIASLSGITYQISSTDAPVPETTTVGIMNSISINLETKGSYRQYLAFLNRLALSPYYFIITDLQARSSGGEFSTNTKINAYIK